MRISSVSVINLFDVFTHFIPLNSDDRMTIVRGPNGVGKTVMLKMIHGIFKMDWSIFQKVPFEEFRVVFDDESTIWVTKSINATDESKSPELNVSFQVAGKEPMSYKPFRRLDRLSKIGYKDLKETILDIEDLTVSEELVHYFSQKQIKSETDDLDLVYRVGSSRKLNSPPEQLQMMIKQMNVIHLIETQRLYSTSKRRDGKKSESEFVVETYSEELGGLIRSKLAESTTMSQSLEKSFPRRLVQSDSAPSVDNLEDTLANIDNKRTRLINAGILDSAIDQEINDLTFDDVNKESLREEKRTALALYLSDLKEKLDFYDDLLTKIELFKDIIRRRFSHKRVTISKQSGFTFITDNQQTLKPTDLSSGEQHEVVLLYELLFRVQPNTLILIDEPEISLHVTWQANFLMDLQRIIDQSKFDVIIATHSPEIIGDRWDLSVLLKGGSND